MPADPRRRVRWRSAANRAAGLNVPTGTIIWLATGTPAPAGYTFIGKTRQDILVPGNTKPSTFIFDLYRKN